MEIVNYYDNKEGVTRAAYRVYYALHSSGANNEMMFISDIS